MGMIQRGEGHLELIGKVSSAGHVETIGYTASENRSDFVSFLIIPNIDGNF